MTHQPLQTRILNENEAGQRLDRFLRKAFKKTPLSLIHKFIRMGLVRVNGKRVKGDVMLSTGDKVDYPETAFFEWKRTPRPTGGLNLRDHIIYEDGHLIAINKPAGLLVHPIERREALTLIDALIGYLKSTEGASWSFKPALVHRLDAETSGITVTAKNARALRNLTGQFRERETVKEYYAVVNGVPGSSQGRIDQPLEDQKGVLRESLTEYTVEKKGNRCALLRLRIHTGRIHQIRRHLTAIGHPIMGDHRYGGPRAERLFLHAWRLALHHPETGKVLQLEAPLPVEFQNLSSF
ncbi:MAG: hypothetical protein A2293_02000 [Elusimicrobia bacterium RIFOXYB2_FULL_49_7]|nr:MAG: hypothetical protein A2293_02000 [Elusimicrobia bacterium RIFOXYB2_FULL_49_7]